MKATLKNAYPKNGTIMFVFHVEGTDAELKEYEQAQRTFVRKDGTAMDIFRTTDEGVPLFFSPSDAHGCRKGQSVDLMITVNNKVVVDNMDEMIDKSIRMRNNIERIQAMALAGQAVTEPAVVDGGLIEPAM